MTGWDARILEPPSPQSTVPERVQALFEQQRATWSMLSAGEAMLESMKTTRFSLDGRHVVVQANPGRRISTDAKVDPASVAQRPCFLCPDTLPPPERGIALGEYILLPNPYPILKHHATIAYRTHVPQTIQGRISDLLALTEALGPEMFVIYNGPRCGASAPDHLHFQTGRSKGVPLFEQVPAGIDDRVFPLAIGERNLLVCDFTQADQAHACIRTVIDALREITGEADEPMINIVATHRENRYTVCIFPRAKHRSACYFAQPSEQVLISPAAMEMAGVVVVANPDHFDRVDELIIRSMYREVTLGNDQFNRIVERLS